MELAIYRTSPALPLPPTTGTPAAQIPEMAHEWPIPFATWNTPAALQPQRISHRDFAPSLSLSVIDVEPGTRLVRVYAMRGRGERFGSHKVVS